MVVLGAALHDIGMSIHRSGHEQYSLILAAPGGLEIDDHPPTNLGALPPGEFFAALTNNLAFLGPFIPPAVSPELFGAARARAR